MNKLKKMFGSNKDEQPTSQSTSTDPSQSPSAQAIPTDLKGVLMTTNYGDITIALYAEQTPRTCKNFATLANTHKYDQVIFHRIIPNFMIQGGDPTGTGTGGKSIYGKKFEDEIVASLSHDRKGVLSMANSGPATNGSQFFITLAPTPHLDGKHTVFGQVVEGMDVVDRIAAVKTEYPDRPVKEVMIVKAEAF